MFALALLLLTAAPAEPRFEVALTPVSAQLNGVDREHLGTSARVTWRFHRLLGVFAGAGYSWVSQRPQEVVQLEQAVSRVDVGRPFLTLLTWSTVLGVESLPLSGDLQLFGVEGRSSLAVSLGAGPAGARVELVPSRYASVDVRLAGQAAVAWRLEFGAFIVSLGLRGTLWGDSRTHVNNCSIDDLRGLDASLRGGQTPDVRGRSPGCFYASTNDVPQMLNVLRLDSSSLGFNLAGELGLGWSFF